MESLSFPPSVLLRPLTLQFQKEAVGWHHMPRRKHVFDFALPDWELLCDSGEMSGDWELAVTKLKQINQISLYAWNLHVL